MSTEPNRAILPWPWSWWDGIRRARYALAVPAAVMFGLVLFGWLTPWPALLAFLLLAAGILIDIESLLFRRPSVPVQEIARPLVADWLIESIVSGMPDPAIVLEHEGQVLASNEPARAIFSALTRGAPLWFALRVTEILDAVRLVGRTGEAQRREFMQRIPADRWMEAVVIPVALPESIAGRRDVIVITLRDLTQLRQVEEMRADFVANASHELRTPLASLSGFIDTLQGPARDDPAARERFLAIMKEQATRMARLIDDLLSLSRIELKAHVQPTQKVELAAIVRQVADTLQPLARERNVVVAVDQPAEPTAVRGDRDELIRLFENLIENALKYGASGGRVEIALRHEAGEQGNDAVVAVRDYGPGIAPEHLPRLTERFYRVDTAGSRAQGGTGLGLALVKHILTRHRGRLAIESVLGQGATFTARLPRVEADPAPTENIYMNQ
jgi:two-component system, OmpR family, phosphate regulon sensor histidine kinase PhoR